MHERKKSSVSVKKKKFHLVKNGYGMSIFSFIDLQKNHDVKCALRQINTATHKLTCNFTYFK